jgi:hypothetical protein
MNKAKKMVVGFFVIVAVIIAILFFISIKQTKTAYECDQNILLPKTLVFYSGETCPHCKIVEEFITKNNISNKINITNKEVFKIENNAKELLLVGNSCKLPSNYLGAVPLLYYQNKAYIGDKDIIQFFKDTLGVK